MSHWDRRNDRTWDQVRTALIVKWVLVAVFAAFFLASGIPGLLIAGGVLTAMGVHHSRERDLWHALHASVPTPSPAGIDADEAARIVAEWEPPTVVIPDQVATPRPGRHATRT